MDRRDSLGLNRWMRLLIALILCFSAGAVRGGTLVQMNTSVGDMVLELYDADKPVTVANFLQYVNEGAYKDSFFHRAVPNFVFQGGGFTVSNRVSPNAQVFAVPTHAPITNEIHVGKFYSNVRGTISMAKTSDPNSATSQFFINTADNTTTLDDTNNSGGFTVFGRVVGGLNVLDILGTFNGTNSVHSTNLIINAGGPFTELPVIKVTSNPDGTVNVDLADLVYANMNTLPAVQVSVAKRTDGSREISWNQWPVWTNTVEYTASFPANWQTLTNVPPGTNQITVVDSAAVTSRFYRVRVQSP
jgi:peptidyl-prolyl cis-trans isomerase A (cyclophilin A)